MIVLMIVTCLSFTALWLCASFLVPRDATSLYRYDLWALRDKLKDDIYHQRLPRVSVVVELLETIELSIRYSTSVTLSEFLATRIARSASTQPNAILTSYAISQLPEPQGKLLLSYVDRVADSVMLKLVMTGPFGWIVFLSEYVLGREKLCALVFWLLSTKPRDADETRNMELRRLRQMREILSKREAEIAPLANHAA